MGDAHVEDYGYLVERAGALGAIEARLLPAKAVVVERRVTLKCRFGCPDYGRSYSCPPHAPTVEAFREALREYRAALVVAFPSAATLTGAESRSLQRTRYGDGAAEARERVEDFYGRFEESKAAAFAALLELEREAFARGDALALALRPGRCTLCPTCEAEAGRPCRHPTRLRFSPEAAGVNLAATCRRAAMDLIFPFDKRPSHVGIVLLG